MEAQDLARRFALAGTAKLSDEPVARGKQGVVWRLETEDGSWAVKVPFEPTSEDELQLAIEFQEAAHAAGVPTPQVRRTIDGRLSTKVEGRLVSVFEWVDLRAPATDLDPTVVGAAVAAIHRVAVTSVGQFDAWYHEPIGADRWDHLIGELRKERAPFTGRLAGLRDELLALESWIEPPQMLQMCHRDLWADNVLGTADGGVCIIDWEDSGAADPNQELACVLFEFARSDPGRARELIDAYTDAGGPGVLDRRGNFSMLIAQLGHITEMAAADWLKPNLRSPGRSDSAAWIGEVLDEPHTRELLDRLLRAIRRDPPSENDV
jgi:Ser/Thr protein kinase RdoA (MazF antagonist)